MKKKLLFLLTALLLSGVSAFAQGGTTGPLTWNLNDGTLTISGTGAMPNYGEREAPWYNYRESINVGVLETGITGIGVHAFFDCISLMLSSKYSHADAIKSALRASLPNPPSFSFI